MDVADYFGEGAVRCVGKVFCYRRRDGGTVIAGVVASPEMFDKDTEYDEMWEGEIIFIPRRKYRDADHPVFHAMRPDQKLTSDWWKPEFWKDKFFSKDK